MRRTGGWSIERTGSTDPIAGADASEAELTFSGANSLDWRERSCLSIGGGDAYAVPIESSVLPGHNVLELNRS